MALINLFNFRWLVKVEVIKISFQFYIFDFISLQFLFNLRRKSLFLFFELFFVSQQLLQFLSSLLSLLFAFQEIVIQLKICLFDFLQILFVAVGLFVYSSTGELGKLSLKSFMKVLHHVLELPEKRPFSNEMLDILQYLGNDGIDFILSIEVDWVGYISYFIHHKELFFSLQADHLKVLLQSQRFIHDNSMVQLYIINNYHQHKTMADARLSKTGKDVSLQLPLIERGVEKSINLTKSQRADNSSKKHDSGHYRLVQTQARKRNPSLLEAHFYQPQSVGMNVQNQPEQFKSSIHIPSQFVFDKYQVLDLTYSLINSNINSTFLMVLFLLQILIRYFSIMTLVYLMIESNFRQWEWILFLLSTAMVYFTCIVKISIKAPETQSEYILKEAFNSLQENQNLEYFQVIDGKKLIKSILRGFVPPELSFLYIKDMRMHKNINIYSMINYIYNSLEAVIYYPLFFVYTLIIFNDDKIPNGAWPFGIAYFTIAFSELIFISLSIYLLVFGCRKKGYFSKKSQ